MQLTRISAALVAGVAAGSMLVRAQAPPAPQAQQVPLEFEVASVKINTSGDTQMRLAIPPGAGRVDVVNMPLRALIQAAYSMPANQVDNVPTWVSDTRIDIVAKADPSASIQQLRAMLQPLLVERFKLAFHHEPRDRDVYALVVAKPGTLGPNIKPSAADCGALADTPRNALPAPVAGQPPACGIIPSGPGRIVVKGSRMQGFVALLSLATAALGGRQVVDQTGLTGGYDIALTYTPEALSAAALAQRQGGAPAFAGVDPNGPNLFQALQDQLGLKLESRKLPLDIMVIDHVERPIPD